MPEALRVGVLTSSSSDLLVAGLSGMPDLTITRVEKPGDLHHSIDSFDVLLVNNRYYLPEVAELVGRAKRLRYLHFVSSGYENLVSNGAPSHLIVSRGGGPSHAITVAEHAVALLLGLMRQLPQLERNRAAVAWDREALRARTSSLEGANVLIVGFGAIGQEAARRLRPFEARIVGMLRSEPPPDVAALADQIVHPAGFPAALAAADAVILSIPLAPETEHMIGAAQLASMKPTSYLVNVARGGLIDDAALVDALRAGRIAGAALDVFEPEPLPPESPLWQLENVILSPHAASSGSEAGHDRVIALTRENLERFRTGRAPLNPIAGFAQTVPA